MRTFDMRTALFGLSEDIKIRLSQYRKDPLQDLAWVRKRLDSLEKQHKMIETFNKGRRVEVKVLK